VKAVSEHQVLERELHGPIITPDDAEYDATRQIWNGMIDRRPALIVRCADATDVPRVIRFARGRDLELAIRGGGHNIAGSALCDAGVVLDMSSMTEVVVDADRRRAVVQPGATLGQVDAATQAHGLATPLGINSTTGVAGLTLAAGSAG
jgi:FAD/FMN-containing dehydrogenase